MKIESKSAFYAYKFGFLKIEYTDSHIVGIHRVKQITENNLQSELSNLAFIQISEYLDGERKTFDLPILMIGTDFQKRVWTALCDIPYGETRTYKEIATIIGDEKACRAVGGANNKNPLGIVVPCHRVIGSNQKLVGYAGGIEVKKALLKLEARNKNK